MGTITPLDIAISIVNILALPLLLWYIKYKFEKIEDKREAAKIKQQENERKATEQREAERTMLLAIARTMLLDNFEKCMAKGCYTVDEREVYSLLYDSYKEDDGNGVIDAIAERIRELPMEPPKD